MCIRDRFYVGMNSFNNGHFGFNNLQECIESYSHKFNDVWWTTFEAPVSYTHLDVYKRQPQDHARLGIPARQAHEICSFAHRLAKSRNHQFVKRSVGVAGDAELAQDDNIFGWRAGQYLDFVRARLGLKSQACGCRRRIEGAYRASRARGSEAECCNGNHK